MLPSPGIYSGPFPPRDPRLPSLGRYPEIVGGANIAEEAMAAFEERHAPLKEIAYARTGRAPQADASTQASPETGEMASGPDEVASGSDGEAPKGGFVSGAKAGWKHFFRPGSVLGYGAGAVGAGAAGMALGAAKGVIGHVMGHGDDPLGVADEPEARVEPKEEPKEEPKPEAVPAYLLDRGEASRPKKMKFVEKERIRIREQAAMEGEHPFHPWRK